jgi:hypothetical protein
VSAAAELDVGLARRLPSYATYVGEVAFGHLVFYLGDADGTDWVPAGTAQYRCVRCGGWSPGLPTEECRGHHPHETEQEAEDRLAAVLCRRTAVEVAAYRRTWGAAPPLVVALDEQDGAPVDA